MKKLTDLLVPERIRIVTESKNPELLYDLLDKYFPSYTRDELKGKFKIEVNFIRGILTFTSTTAADNVELFSVLTRAGLKYTRYSNFLFVTDLYNFMYTII